MMEDHFGLERAPFRLGTDASFYYEAEAHRRAMAHLRYGLRQAEGFVVVTGEPGVGKTMVIEQLLLSVQDSDVLAGMLVPNGLTEKNLAERVLAAFDRRPVDGVDATESLRDYLADERRRGAKASLIIDEAQHLSDALLEELRLLSDLTHDGDALLQVCLIGQTALRRVLFRDDMEQFRQRIVASYHLAPLSAEDTEAYIRHRMRAAGREGPDVFTEDALGAIHRLTGGVPRRINTLCARLLLQASMDGRDVVDADAAQGSAAEVEETPRGPAPEAEGAPTPEPEAQRPNLTLVTPSPREDQVPDPDPVLDEEAEAERALALVTAPPSQTPSPRTQPSQAPMLRTPTSQTPRSQAPRSSPVTTEPVPPAQAQPPAAPPAVAQPPAYALRAEGGGSQGAYPVTVGEINAAIQSIQAPSVVEVRPAARSEAQPADRSDPAPTDAPVSKPRMASPQELMLRRPKTASAESPADARAPEAADARQAAGPRAAPEPKTGDQERAVRDFLAETERALSALRAAMDTLRARVDGLDAQRRDRRERIERAAEEAEARLDDLRLER